MREEIPYIIAYVPILLFSLLLFYLRYEIKAKRYVRIFKKALINGGMPRSVALKLCSEIRVGSPGDFLNIGSAFMRESALSRKSGYGNKRD